MIWLKISLLALFAYLYNIKDDTSCLRFQFVAVRESLKADGNLDRIKAEMRTEVIKLLDCSSKENKSKTVKPSHDIIFLNELIREYLDWMGYKYSSTVFIAGILFYGIYTTVYIPIFNNSERCIRCEIIQFLLNKISQWIRR